MTTAAVLDDVHPIDALMQDFLARRKCGENPSVEDYAAANPEFADEIRDAFEAALILEEMKGDPPPFAASANARTLSGEFGDFTILGEIGRGGMGVVYEAVQRSLDRRVALKVLPDADSAEPRRLERFRREAIAAGRLHHTNIVPVFGVGEQDGRHYYAMQFIAGQGLDHILTWLSFEQLKGPRGPREFPGPDALAQTQFMTPTSAGKLASDGRPPSSGMIPAARTVWFPSVSDPEYYRQVARLGAEVADALSYAHAHGILHRDIKPSNLLLDRDGQIWVADFGLAKLDDRDDLTKPGEMAGTLRYSAPERFRGQTDARSDVFSLALTLYELCALRPAYDENDPARLLARATEAVIHPIRRFNPAVPLDLETVLLKALQADPGKRYPTAAEFADDLRRFLNDRSISARRTSPVEHARRWVRRNPVVATLTAMLVVVVLGALGLVIRKWREAESSLADARDANSRAEAALVREAEQRTRADTQRAEADAQRTRADDDRRRADGLRDRADRNLKLALEAFDRVAAQLSLSRDGSDEMPVAPVLLPETAAVLEYLVRFHEQYAAANNDVRLDSEIARALRRIGNIRLRLGQTGDAETSFRRALALVGDAPGKALDRARIRNDLGQVLRARSAFESARKEHFAALTLLGTTPGGHEEKLERARAHEGVALTRLAEKKSADADKAAREALTIVAGVRRDDGDPAAARHLEARLRGVLSLAASDRGASVEEADRAALLYEELLGGGTGGTDYKAELAEVLLARPVSTPPTPKDIEKAQRAADLTADLASRYSQVPEYRVMQDRARERLALLSRPETPPRVVPPDDPGRKGGRVNPLALLAAEGKLIVAEGLKKRNDFAGAERIIRQSLGEVKKLAGVEARSPQLRSLLGRHHKALAEVLTRLGKSKEAEAECAEAEKLGGRT